MFEDTLARLRRNPLQTAAFGLCGAFVAIMAELPEWVERIENIGIDAFWYRWPRQMLAICIAGLALVFVLRACTVRGTELLQRPWKFIGMLAGGSLVATVAGWTAHTLIGGTRHSSLFQVPFEKLFDFWWQAMLWGGLTGWLYLLSLQRSDDRQRLSLLLGTRAVLSRQLAAAQLEQSRAHFDPAAVAETLEEIRQRYQDDAATANAMLDSLVADLRRAMKHRRNSDAGQ